jgi:hypothetical protein
MANSRRLRFAVSGRGELFLSDAEEQIVRLSVREREEGFSYLRKCPSDFSSSDSADIIPVLHLILHVNLVFQLIDFCA